MNRARRAVGGDRHRLVDNRVGGAGHHLEAGLHQGADDGGVIDHLMGIGMALPRVDRTGYENQRHPVQFGVGHHIHRVRHAGPDGGQQYRRAAGGVPGAFGHEAGIVFMLGQDEFDSDLAQRLHQHQHFSAGDTVNMGAAALLEALGDQLRGGSHSISSPPVYVACSDNRHGSGAVCGSEGARRPRCAESARCRHRW